MLAYPIAIAAVLMGVDAKSSSSSSPTITHRHKLDFMRAMKTDARSQQRRRKLTEETQKEFKNTLYGNTNESKSLRKKLMSKAKVVEPGSDMHRKLNGEVEEKKDDTTTRKLNNQDQTDDYYSMQGQWANGFTFDAAQFSLSYNRCAAVRQFDDELAAQEDSMDVFATKQYAIFRFCPEATCMGYVDDMEQCGCEEQCQWHGDGGNGNGENNEEQCEEATRPGLAGAASSCRHHRWSHRDPTAGDCGFGDRCSEAARRLQWGGVDAPRHQRGLLGHHLGEL